MRLPTASACAAAAAALHAAAVSAATTSYCPESGICFSWGVPPQSAGSGPATVYFQLRAPTTFAWAGLGIGTQMAGADMFVMYASGSGNVTLSTRRGAAHVMPEHVEQSGVDLLDGSGVSGGQMTANVRCRGCDLDLSGSTCWISAWSQGSPLNSPSPSATIQIHSGFGTFSVDLARAGIQSDANPFLAPGGSGGSGGSGGGVVAGPIQSSPSLTLVYAHGIIMTVVFAAGYPIGSALMPLVGKWLVHASWQTVTFAAMWAGFGIGYVISHGDGTFFNVTHTRLGVFVCSLMGLQPLFGWLHHTYYLRHHGRGPISYVHIWYGRALMILGLVNGGLGLQWAGSQRSFVIAYSVVAAVVTAMYLAAVASGIFRSKQSGRKQWGRVPSVTRSRTPGSTTLN